MELLLRGVKFGLAGLLGMLIDFAVTWLAKEKLSMNKYVANSLGFMVAVTNNYLINRVWTFASVNTHWEVEFAKFILVSLVGLCLNTAIIFLLHQRRNGVNFYLAKFISIAIVFIWNFMANTFFTFK